MFSFEIFTSQSCVTAFNNCLAIIKPLGKLNRIDFLKGVIEDESMKVEKQILEEAFKIQ